MEKTSEVYANINGDFKDTNGCVVRSFAIVLGKTYEEMYEICKRHGRKHGKGMNGAQQELIAEEFGLKKVSLSGFYRGEPTVNQFLKAHPTGTFYVVRSGHAFVIKDGVIHDWKSGTGIRSRIRRAFTFGE